MLNEYQTLDDLAPKATYPSSAEKESSAANIPFTSPDKIWPALLPKLDTRFTVVHSQSKIDEALCDQVKSSTSAKDKMVKDVSLGNLCSTEVGRKSLPLNSSPSLSVMLNDRNGFRVGNGTESGIEHVIESNSRVLSNLCCTGEILSCAGCSRKSVSSDSCVSCQTNDLNSSAATNQPVANLEMKSDFSPVLNKIVNGVGNSDRFVIVKANPIVCENDYDDCNADAVEQWPTSERHPDRNLSKSQLSFYGMVSEGKNTAVKVAISKNKSSVFKGKKQVTIKSDHQVIETDELQNFNHCEVSGETLSCKGSTVVENVETLHVEASEVKEKSPIAKSLEVTNVESIVRYHDSDETDSDAEIAAKKKKVPTATLR